MTYLAAACQGLLIAVLAVSAASKVRRRADFRDFVASLRRTSLVKPSAARVVALVVVSTEGSAALLLLLPGTRRFGFVVAGLLLAVLTAGVAAIVRRGKRVTCRCFGASNAPLQIRHVVRNATLTGAAVVGVIAGASTFNSAAVVVVLIGAVCAAPVILLDDLTELFRPPSPQVHR